MNNTTIRPAAAKKRPMIGLRVDPADMAVVKELARKQNRSMANLALYAMRLGLERIQKEA